MSIIEILGTLLIGPLKLIFEIIFIFANRITGHPGLAIIALSLVMNILVLPLYRRADEMQERARDIDAKLQNGVAHIKKAFSGDERMMILQTYYRQNNYKPTDALNGSVSLLLEVPFFMAAYQFLSSLTLMEGVSLGPIADLSAPDGLIAIGSLNINLLPILMTLVNVISSALYLKGYPLKTKIQLYGMAGFFLVFLYTSPSGLVFYWTLNNLFSLVKTIFYKLRNPKKVLTVLSSICGLFMLTFGVFFYHTDSVIRKLFVIGIGLMLQVPIMLPILLKRIPFRTDRLQITPNRLLFVLGTAFLTVLLGLLIPSAYIASSPQEYINPACFHDPTWYVVSSFCFAAGTFLVWMGIFYWLSTPKIKVIFERAIWIFCSVALVNYMFFGTNLGNISPTLQFDGDVQFAIAERVINIAVLIILSIAMLIFVHKRSKAVITVLVTASIALVGMSVINLVTINRSVAEVVRNQDQQNDDMPTMQMSKDGKNVIIIMLDRAMGEYVPYIFNEKPDLKEQFAGFTYYSNVISHGGNTNFATPALYGGYEYTPVEINKRRTESLVSKQNESLLVLPVLFSNNNFESTVFDPTYANYQWNPDVSIFNDYPEVNAFAYENTFVSKETQVVVTAAIKRNLFCLSIMKSMPLIFQPAIYASGTYLSNSTLVCTQTPTSISTATGADSAFQQCYMALSNLPNTVQVSGETDNAFICASFQLTHQPTLLSVPDYTLSEVIDNTLYEAENADRFFLNGQQLKIDTVANMKAYHTNVAAYILVGNFLNTLRENGVYDNTRIIIVSDHGHREKQLDQLILDITDEFKDVENYFPLLMVKDFNSTEFTTSHEFMTTADVATLATKDVIENPINPFTGKVINNDEKYAHDQIVIVSDQWNPNINNGNTFLPARWASIHDDLWVAENWTFYDKEIVLTEHALPEE